MSSHRHTISLLGFQFSTAGQISSLADEIMEDIGTPGIHHLITPNASQVVYYNEAHNLALKAFYTHSRYILPDGMPIVWLSRLKGIQDLHRLPGSDLFPELWPRIRARTLPAVFVLANSEIAQKLMAEHPASSVIVPKMFSRNDDAYIADLAAEVARAVQASGAHFVFLGLGFPKQEKLGMQLAGLLREDAGRSALILLIGASFEFYYGFKTRAPRWMQQSGLEWLHRFLQEPGRLWKRYTVDSTRFIMLALRDLFRRRDQV
jgi:N-acetylglucosaminyldiphosphoundecaprenol N-acetyl-beta-D-mannosaminyltransferase